MTWSGVAAVLPADPGWWGELIMEVSAAFSPQEGVNPAQKWSADFSAAFSPYDGVKAAKNHSSHRNGRPKCLKSGLTGKLEMDMGRNHGR